MKTLQGAVGSARSGRLTKFARGSLLLLGLSGAALVIAGARAGDSRIDRRRQVAPALRQDRPHSLKARAAEADLVFRGRVQDIQYILSEPFGPEWVRIPYTFVTYIVDDVLHGPEPGLTVTLRFIGGLDVNTLDYLQVSNVPQFDLGDEDVLFVSGNTRRICPLVGNCGGRLRIVGGKVYSDSGRAVKMGDDGALRLGKRFRLPQVMSTNVSFLPPILVELGPNMVDGPSDAIAAEAFVSLIADAAAGLRPAGKFVDADLGQPIAGPDLTPATMPEPPTNEGAALPEPVEAIEMTERVRPDRKD